MIDLDAIRAGLDSHAFFLEYLPVVSIDPERCCAGSARRVSSSPMILGR